MNKNHGIDPRELLRRADPLHGEEIPDVSSARAVEMRARVLSKPRLALTEPVPIRPRIRTRQVAIAAIAALLLAAAAWAFTRSPTNLSGIDCFSEADLSGTHAFVTTENGLVPSACNEVWATGELENPDVEPGTIPPLLACVSDDGILRVFPSNNPQDCARLDLADYEPVSDQQEGDLQSGSELRDNLTNIFVDEKCEPFAETLEQVQTLMTNYPDWTLEVRGTESQQFPCASYGIDFDNNTVLLIPIPSR